MEEERRRRHYSEKKRKERGAERRREKEGERQRVDDQIQRDLDALYPKIKRRDLMRRMQRDVLGKQEQERLYRLYQDDPGSRYAAFGEWGIRTAGRDQTDRDVDAYLARGSNTGRRDVPPSRGEGADRGAPEETPQRSRRPSSQASAGILGMNPGRESGRESGRDSRLSRRDYTYTIPESEEEEELARQKELTRIRDTVSVLEPFLRTMRRDDDTGFRNGFRKITSFSTAKGTDWIIWRRQFEMIV